MLLTVKNGSVCLIANNFFWSIMKRSFILKDRFSTVQSTLTSNTCSILLLFTICGVFIALLSHNLITVFDRCIIYPIIQMRIESETYNVIIKNFCKNFTEKLTKKLPNGKMLALYFLMFRRSHFGHRTQPILVGFYFWLFVIKLKQDNALNGYYDPTCNGMLRHSFATLEGE